MKKLFVGFGVILLLAVVVAATYSLGHFPLAPGIASPFGAQSINIAFLAPLSGDTAVFGENERKGLDLAVDQINTAGGIDGRQVHVTVEDTQCDAHLAVSAAQKVIQVDHVLAIVGDTCSSSVLAMAPVFTAAKVPAITPAAGADSLSGASPYLFRDFIANRQYAAYAGQLIPEQLGAHRAGILYIDNDFGKNMAEDFAADFKGSVVFTEGYTADTTDFRSLLVKLAVANPDIVYLAGYYNDGALIIRQAKQLGFTFRYFGSGDAYDDPQFIALAGAENLEGFAYVSVPIARGPAAQPFKAAFVAQYGENPPVYSDNTYDTVYAIAAAIRAALAKGPLTSAAVAEELRATNLAGASDTIAFDENGDLVNPSIVTKVVKNGAATTTTIGQ